MEEKETPEQKSEIKLDGKSKALFAIVAVLIAGSVAVTFWRYMIKKDYSIEAQTDCDPETENCFIWKCDPNSMEEGEKCTGVPDNDIWYYKIIRRDAKNIPLCDPKDENCAALTCPEGEKDCEEVLCGPENANAAECNNPEQYLLENPLAEECAPDDQECLDAQSTDEECAPDDEECAASEEEECAPDDQECLDQSQQQYSTESTDEGAREQTPQKDAMPAGVEPM